MTLNSCYFQRSHAAVVGTATSMNDHSAFCHIFNSHHKIPTDRFMMMIYKHNYWITMFQLIIKCVFHVTEPNLNVYHSWKRIQTWYVETGDMYGDMDVWAIILFEILYACGKNLWTQKKSVFFLSKKWSTMNIYILTAALQSSLVL